MMRDLAYAAVGSLLLGAVGWLFISKAYADVSYSVSPSVLEFAVDPGDSFVQKIVVGNEGDEPVHLFVNIGPTVADRPDISAEGWLRVNPTEFDIKPGESQEVTVQVTVPKDVDTGGRYSNIIISSGPEVVGQQGEDFAADTAVEPRIVVPLLLTVRGQGVSLLGDVTRVVPLIAGQDSVAFLVEVQNMGNVHFVPRGEVQVLNNRGEEVARLTISEGTPLMPGVTGRYEVLGSAQLPAGDYRAHVRLDIGWDADQIQAAKVDPAQWSEVKAQKEQAFNSMPKLGIIDIKAKVSDVEQARFVIELENTGDVAMTPVGFVDVVTEQRQRIFLVNINRPDWLVEPHSGSTLELVYGGPLPKGKYQAIASLSYFGATTADKTIAFEVDEAIVPPELSTPPPEEPAELKPAGGGLPTWVWIAVSAGAVVFLFGAFVAYRLWITRDWDQEE